MIEFWSETHPKARKEYCCDLCRSQISAGQHYARCTGKADGDMQDYKYHNECHAIIKEYCSKYDDDYYDPDEIRYWIDDEVCRDSCTMEERDDCHCSVFGCEKVLKRLGISKEEHHAAD